MNGNNFFGRSGGSLASIASSGISATTGGASCGSAGGTISPYVCALPGQGIQSVTNQTYTPSQADLEFATICKSSHP